MNLKDQIKLCYDVKGNLSFKKSIRFPNQMIQEQSGKLCTIAEI